MGILFLNSIFFIVISVIINQFVFHLHVVAKNVLIQGDELNSLDPTSTLQSPNGIFTLGFFTIPSTNLSYLGIWYTSDTRKVWIANRDIPMNSSGVVLMIDEFGTLKVINKGTNITLFNVSNEILSSSGINTRVVLEDSGNFVLYDNLISNRILWQSFDHPIDTLIPGMKLGYNLTTGQDWSLTSCFSDQIPASGAFTLGLEQFEDSYQLVIYRRGKLYWSSGPWLYGRRFELEFSKPGSIPGTLVLDTSGMYFSIQTHDIKVISMLLLTPMGLLMDSGNNPAFVMSDLNVPFIGVLNSDKPLKKKEKNGIWIWIRVSTVASVLTCALAALLCYGKRKVEEKEKKTRDEYLHQLTGSASFNYGDILIGIKDAPDIKIFSFRAISDATNNFSIENKLGQGGYGPVYKGKLFDGREIAVKRLSRTSGQGIEEFKSELILISKLQHTNLVQLYGCCINQEEKMLIYEFMPNKSLDFFLFAQDKKEVLDWRMRFNIIEGVAQGLLYLHKYSRMKIVHRDLKVSNILLDKNMNPKIADFGMARIFQQNVTEAITNRVVGTYGYMAPEYAMEGTFSTKSDVFSFGVLVLKIVSGKNNSRFCDTDRPLNFLGYAWELWKEDAASKLKDEALGESFDLKQLLRTIHIGLLCVQDNAEDRPTMFEVVSMFNNEIANLPNPRQPIFVTSRQPAKDSSTKNNIVSVNGLSITTMEAR